MPALEGRTVDTAEDSLRQAGIMTASQGRVVSPLRLTHADLSRQPRLKDTYPSERPEPQQSRWHTQWLATTLILTTLPLFTGAIGLLFFSQVDPLLMIALLLVGGSGLLVVAGGYVLLPTIYMEIRHFSVELCPRVVIGNDCGTIRITAGSTSNEVTILATTWNGRGWKASDGIWADYKQAGNTITAWVVRSNTSRIHDIDYVDVDITVPSNTDLRLTTKTGDIRVTGISGQMHLGSESGSVLVQQGILRGTSWLMTNAGAIHYYEAIDPHGTYTFVSTTGSITVILPSDASFHLDARTDTGTITTDFPGVVVTHRTNNAIQSTVGKPPHAKVRLSSDSGSIQLYGGPQENAQPLE